MSTLAGIKVEDRKTAMERKQRNERDGTWALRMALDSSARLLSVVHVMITFHAVTNCDPRHHLHRLGWKQYVDYIQVCFLTKQVQQCSLVLTFRGTPHGPMGPWVIFNRTAAG